ncbi:MAG: hypothetical protein E6Q76_06165 [Rhizobium sp.]|nr:MAG: hypothetical protein E6Q76_06165 [Rhizobium sp.]
MSSAAIFRKNVLSLFSIAALSLMAACASAPTSIGDHALAQGEKWNRGNELVEDGQELIEDGQELINEGNKQVETGNEKLSKGKSMINEGQTLMLEAEASMRALHGGSAPN